MKVNSVVLGLVALSFANVASAARLTPEQRAYFTIGRPHVELVSETLPDAGKGLDLDVSTMAPADGVPTDGATILEGLNEADMILDKVINMGKKIWAIIEANKPVVNVQTDSANALPEGSKSWLNLQGWQAPVARVYRVNYTNVYGMNVVDFSYRVQFTAGGSVGGKGRYLAQVSVMPANLDVAWGYQFNMTASVPTVTNAGTTADPVGAANVVVTWKIDTVMKHSEESQSYYVQGDGKFLDLSQGN
jgi:hypothetical protein